MDKKTCVFFSLFVFLVSARGLAAQIKIVNIDNLDNANAIIVQSNEEFDIKNSDNARYRVSKKITILNEKGDEHAKIGVSYDKFRSIKKLEGVVTDIFGSKIKKIKKDDIVDTATNSGGTLYSDSRLRYVDLSQDKYPYTVQYSYELHYKQSLNWPDWYPAESDAFVKSSTFIVSYPLNYPVRYHVRGNIPEVSAVEGDKTNVLTWSVKNLPAFTPESHGPAWADQADAVRVAPGRFRIGESRGSMSSWQEFGDWYHALNNNRQRLSATEKASVARLTSGLDKKEKIEALYRYMQQNTRYVAVQLGIGGWQTFPASYVSENKYGDCKALTNYMFSLLLEAGIESNPALVKASRGASSLIEEFPSNQFNHIILAIPDVEGDTLWLENTSQTAPFGHLGDSTEDRKVLLIKRNGSQIVRTPSTPSRLSSQIRQGEIQIDEKGNATIEFLTSYSGNQQDRVRSTFGGQTERVREERLASFLDLASYKLIESDFSDTENPDLQIDLPLKLELRRYAKKSGSRIFFRPNIFELGGSALDALEDGEERLFDVRTTVYPYFDSDSLKFFPPEGYVVEAIPREVDLKSDFGSYHTKIEAIEDGSLLYTRKKELTKTYIDKSRYEEFRVFIKKARDSDHGQVVLVKSKS